MKVTILNAYLCKNKEELNILYYYLYLLFNDKSKNYILKFSTNSPTINISNDNAVILTL